MTKQLMKLETWLPCFPGFYQSLFNPDDEIDSEIEDINHHRKAQGFDPIDYDDCEWDNAGYEEAVAQGCVAYLNDLLKDWGVQFTFQSIWHPREYNFKTDSVNVEVELDPDRIDKWVDSKYELIAEAVRKAHTSRDGFISYHSNDMDDWVDEFYDDAYKIGFILECLIEMETDYDDMDMYEWATEDVHYSATNYHELINKEEIE